MKTEVDKAMDDQDQMTGIFRHRLTARTLSFDLGGGCSIHPGGTLK